MYASDKVKEECLKEAEGRQKKVTVDHDYTEVEYASPKYFEVVKKIKAESEDSITSEGHTFKIIHSCKQPVDEDALMPTEEIYERKRLIATLLCRPILCRCTKERHSLPLLTSMKPVSMRCTAMLAFLP